MATILKNIKSKINFLLNPEPALTKACEDVQDILFSNWNSGKGGDGKPMNRLSDDYKKYKQKKGLNGIPDVKLSGDLRNSFVVKKKSRYNYALSINNSKERKKLGYYEELRPNVISVSDKMVKEVKKEIVEALKK